MQESESLGCPGAGNPEAGEGANADPAGDEALGGDGRGGGWGGVWREAGKLDTLEHRVPRQGGAEAPAHLMAAAVQV